MDLSPRKTFALGALLCALLLGTAAYLQYVGGIEPCPLCIIQRFFVLLIGLTFLIGSFHTQNYLSMKVYGWTLLIFSVLGVAVAGNQVYLQLMPSGSVASCGPSLEYIFKNVPIHKAFLLVLKGAGECAAVQARFFGLSIPAWMLLFFLLFTGISIWTIKRRVE